MKNFKQIAEDCLAGKLSGTFVIDKGKNWHSSYLQRHTVLGREMPGQYVLGPGVIYNEMGQCESREKIRIIDFIPDNMQKKIKIDIPEGKVPVVEQTEKGVVITWKEKELTYKDIENKLILKNTHDCIIGYTPVIEDIKTFNCTHSDFYKKVEVLRKLTNIRNYFGKRTTNIGYVIAMEFGEIIVIEIKTPLCFSGDVIFAKKEHAEQAIKILGDELKYLFEPW
jgi:hypothetical protein